jgi:hypothetical protein
MNEEEIQKHKVIIDIMSHYEMAHLYRFAPSGHMYFNIKYPLYDYFMKRFKSLGGMTAEISKEIGL